MILGASHLTFAAAEPAEARRLLIEAGFKLEFEQRRVPNSPEKAPFLSPSARAAETLDISYFKGDRGPALELVAYPSPGSSAGRQFIPLFARGLPAPLRAGLPSWESAPKAALPVATAGPTTTEQGLIALACPAQDLAGSISFWREGLGFSASGGGADWARLELPAALPQWRLKLSLFTDERSTEAPTLDGLGFRCLSLLSSELEKDLELLGRTGAVERSAPFALTVNGKKLRAAVLRGPGRELIELIEVVR
ncbi:MAG: VOC family protein [Elusimicrobia bacterium]|nr:VOC family protein [Elusimicrobiota bacterium]